MHVPSPSGLPTLALQGQAVGTGSLGSTLQVAGPLRARTFVKCHSVSLILGDALVSKNTSSLHPSWPASLHLQVAGELAEDGEACRQRANSGRGVEGTTQVEPSERPAGLSTPPCVHRLHPVTWGLPTPARWAVRVPPPLGWARLMLCFGQRSVGRRPGHRFCFCSLSSWEELPLGLGGCSDLAEVLELPQAERTCVQTPARSLMSPDPQLQRRHPVYTGKCTDI